MFWWLFLFCAAVRIGHLHLPLHHLTRQRKTPPDVSITRIRAPPMWPAQRACYRGCHGHTELPFQCSDHLYYDERSTCEPRALTFAGAQWHRALLPALDAVAGQLLPLHGWCSSSVASDESSTGKQSQVCKVCFTSVCCLKYYQTPSWKYDFLNVFI